MKKFITYKCTQCQRTIDKEVNNLQPFIDKCDITLKCLGRLKPYFVKSTKNMLSSASALEDWIPRYIEKDIKINELNVPEFINIANSFGNHLMLAVEQEQQNQTNIQLRFSIQHENTFDFFEYTYYIEPGISSISGKDNSNNSQILRYTNEDEVLVYMNGKQIFEGTGTDNFQKNIVNNIGYIINFNSPPILKSVIKVVVYKQQSITESDPIDFILNSALSTDLETSWYNITKIHFNNKDYLVYICPDTSNISMNSKLNLYPAENNLDLSKCFFLLSTPNYTIVDRNKTQIIPLNNLVEDNTYIKIQIKDGTYQFLVTSAAVIDIFPEISYLQFKNSSLEYVNERSAISTDLLEKIPNKFIIGPS